jgi:archaellum biogenesis ATPase FlaH
MANIETTILRNLMHNDVYMRKVIPFLKPVYFDEEHRYVFKQIAKFATKYNKLPTKETLEVEISNDEKLGDHLSDRVYPLVQDLEAKELVDNAWLVDQTETWCQDRAVLLAVMDSIDIIQGKTANSKGAIPDLLRDALAVSFDNSVGHDYIADTDSRFEFYNREEEKLPFDLDYFNKITNGGLPNKSLSIILAGTGVGKSLFMTHCASANLSAGKNVLYITLEMAEERVAERIDANLMNVPMIQLKTMDKSSFDRKIEKIVKKTQGQLIIKEYPTSTAHTGHFRALLRDLEMKKEFKPDIIYIDYLNICASARVKAGGAINSYTLIKSIAEEIRGLAMEFDVPIVSATQTTRSGYNSSDVELSDTSESFGLPATADFMFALISNEELEELGQLMVKQLKNRYGDLNSYKRFMIGVDRSKMKLYDVEDSAQQAITDAGDSSPPWDTDDKPINRFGANEKNFNFEGLA